MRAVKKNPKTTVSDITNNLQRAGVTVQQSNSKSYSKRTDTKFWDKVSWSDETKMNFTKVM